MQYPFFARIIIRMKSATHHWSAILRAVSWVVITTAFFATGARVLFFGLPEHIAALLPAQSQAAATTQFEYRKQHASSTSDIPLGLRANAVEIDFDSFRVEKL